MARKLPIIPLCGALLAFALSLPGCGGGGGATTPAPPATPGPPSPPASVAAAAGQGSVTVTWPPAAGASSYNLYWSGSPGVTKSTGTPVVGAVSPHVQEGLPGGSAYHFIVASVDDRGVEGPASVEAAASVPAPSPQGPDIEQYFDRDYNGPADAGGNRNYFDNSSHPLAIAASASGMTFPAPMENCLWCHGARYRSGGRLRYGNECVKCHFEHDGGPSLGGNHMNGVIELSDPSNSVPTLRFDVATMADYDAWCLRCHDGGSVTLGGILPSPARRTDISAADFANGRHRAVVPPDGPIGCIHCHQPHGRGNARIVRENPVNRRTAGPTPMTFGVYPNDGLNLGAYGPPQNVPFRARVDNTAPNVFADAGDANNYCNKACHDVTASRRKDKIIRRDDNITGNYTPNPTNNKKLYIVNGLQYTNDNTSTWMHGHPNNEIINTDRMVADYAALVNLSGPSYYKYPGTGDANPASFANDASPLPFFPDFEDGIRDFTNGHVNMGPIRYRFTCSTCHNPHGTPWPNGNATSSGYPDLRLQRIPKDLCNQCHR